MRNLLSAALITLAVSASAQKAVPLSELNDDVRAQMMEKIRLHRTATGRPMAEERDRSSEGLVRIVLAKSRDQALEAVRAGSGARVMAITKRSSGWTEALVAEALDRELAGSAGVLVIDNALVTVSEANGLIPRLKALKDKGIQVFFVRY